MGYRFTLESANTVAKLTFGKVMSCYRDIYSSSECYEEFMYFLDQFHQNLYSNDMERYMRSVRTIHKTLPSYEDYKRRLEKVKYDDTFLLFWKDALDALRELSRIFEECTTKSLLLPPMKDSDRCSYNFMTSPRTLRMLFELHKGDSCLILQPQEQPHNATIFNAFPNFDVALRQADMWPAVLFWEGLDDYAFIPVKHEDELLYLYEIIKYERYPIDELKRIAEGKKKTSHYIFQLSDLHFGAKNVDVAERRLRTLVKSQLSKIESCDSINFVITGDAVDKPKETAESVYSNFAEYIEDQCGQKPIRILGNHDINTHGIAIFHGKQHIANIVGEYPKIKIIEESKVILLLFNSNTNGNFAEGEIGTVQMTEMGNLLDKVGNLENYLLVAVLHHHLLPIPKPSYYDQKWFEKILPTNFMDMSLKLLDAQLFFDWLRQRNVRIVLHGHKHIPFFAESDGITVIGCGSSTGQIVHKEKGKTFISYNMLKISERTITCTQFAEEVYGAGAKNIRTEIIEL
ncbi:metallophosphoesterase [Desulfovibrio sp. ZJ369]|uniref:metallophosphoesterase family protein n=1 Tax=Desulfovibrio sp. ZJ369 TaxID=2709793 RepID=UPI001981E708|nr:metallophosphoesterase [Desulfovibrio sp. ZJ369]